MTEAKRYIITIEYITGGRIGEKEKRESNIEYTVGSTNTSLATGDMFKVVEVQENPAWQKPKYGKGFWV